MSLFQEQVATMIPVVPVLGFAGSGGVVADLDALAESGLFIEATTRSGKTNLVRVFCEQNYGVVQQIIFDPEGQYYTLRSTERPYLVVGRGRDVEIVANTAVVRRFVAALVEKGVSVIFDLFNYEDDEQQVIVAAACAELVSMPETHPGTIAVVIEELQDFAPQSGGGDTALSAIRRLAKRGLKRGVFIIGITLRVADVSKGVVTSLKTKIIGGTDSKDAPRALEELGFPPRERSFVTDLPIGRFWVKGPAFERKAQLVDVPLSRSAPAKRVRGEPPAPAAEAPAEIAALAALLAENAADLVEEPGAKLSAQALADRAVAAAVREADEAHGLTVSRISQRVASAKSILAHDVPQALGLLEELLTKASDAIEAAGILAAPHHDDVNFTRGVPNA